MPNLLNQLIYKELRTLFEKHPSAVFVKFSTFTQADSEEARKSAREAGGLAFVLKNSVCSRVLSDMGVEGHDAVLTGPVLAIMGDDPVALAAAAVKYHKKRKKGEPVGGLYEGKIVTAEDVVKLSTLPSREQLIAQVLSIMVSPLRGLVTVLGGNIRGLAVALNAIKEKKEKEAA
ncbi:MAG: 50S ribosomal protein L10 [Planctomycetes bacterium]|nr:50S ribosomal protein L10 [Planctomycetota bacterium]